MSREQGENEEKVFNVWFGRQAFANEQQITCAPLRAVEDEGGVEQLRFLMGMQRMLHQHMTTEETKLEEDKEAENNPNKIMRMVEDVAVDEDRVLLHAKLPFTVDTGGILSQEEAEKLLTLLAAPYMSISLTLDFFAEQERVGHLLDDKLAKLLEQLLFEPQAFQTAAGLLMHTSVGLAAPTLTTAEAEEEELVPVPPNQRSRLGTPHGVLHHDLRFRPACVLKALVRLCNEGVAKCVSHSASSYVSLLMTLIRIAMAIEATMLSVLTDLEHAHEPCFGEVYDEALPELKRLRDEFVAPAEQLLEHWIVQEAKESANQVLRRGARARFCSHRPAAHRRKRTFQARRPSVPSCAVVSVSRIPCGLDSTPPHAQFFFTATSCCCEATFTADGPRRWSTVVCLL